MKISGNSFPLFSVFIFLIAPAFAFADSDDKSATDRRLEEVVVYGQKMEATVSDTSVAITALDTDFLEESGIQDPNEMINFIPAATRTAWDIKIRGIGRNFRGLGGDPGIGTYYNGAYSPDFGIASTEAGLYDVERIEVLRGPQGTLYGRNSIGGVINYVTKKPNPDAFEASGRLIVGKYGTNEWYGVVSGPINDSLAYRINATKRVRDPWIPGLGNTDDLGSINDRNEVVALDWRASDSLRFSFRANDRYSHNNGNFATGGHGIVSEGPCVSDKKVTSTSQCDPRYRVPRDTNYYAPGFRPVTAAYYATYGDLADGALGAVQWTHPITGAAVYGAYNRPGVDNTSIWPYMPTGNYHDPLVGRYNIGSADAPDIVALTNGHDREGFEHQSATLRADWDVSPELSVSYVGAYQWFSYSFNRDNDYSASNVGDNNDTDVESVHSYSHELRLFWQLGDRWTATTGLYQFKEHRRQLYGIRERAAQGRVSDPTLYGPDGDTNVLLDALKVVGWIMPDCMFYRDVPVNAGPSIHPGYGAYCGDRAGRVKYDMYRDTDAVYEQDNRVDNENLAFYTQGDLKLTDNFSVTLGVRYSKDMREGIEQRGGYSELNANEYSAWLPYAISCVLGAGALGGCPATGDSTIPGYSTGWTVHTIPGVNWWEVYNPGVNGLAAMNVAMGNATFSGDPDFPITPVCAYDDPNCTHPLRLEGIPISWGSRANGKYEPDAETSWRVNFNWAPSNDLLVYFGVTTGYRAGGWDMGGTDNRALVDTDGVGVCDASNAGFGGDTSGCDRVILLQYKPEKVTSYEVGYKGTHMDGRLQLNAAAYYYDYRNYQDSVDRWEDSNGSFTLPNITLPDGSPLGAPPGRGPVLSTINIPKATNRGFELDAEFLATDDLIVGGNYSYTISEYHSSFLFFNQNDPRYPRSVFSGGNLSSNPCEAAPEVRKLYCLDANGLELQGIPKQKAALWTNYDFHLNVGTLTWTVTYSYTGEYSTNAFNRPWDIVPARNNIDTRMTLHQSAHRWMVSLFVDNVLDKTYANLSDMSPRLTGYGSNYPQRVVAMYPRFIGMEMVYNFGAAAR